jgi:hypothetical protein
MIFSSGWMSMALTGQFVPAPGSKEVSREPSVLSLAMRLRVTPL